VGIPEFAETLKKLRAERGLSQIQLGEQMFVNQSTVAQQQVFTASEAPIRYSKAPTIQLFLQKHIP